MRAKHTVTWDQAGASVIRYLLLLSICAKKASDFASRERWFHLAGWILGHSMAEQDARKKSCVPKEGLCRSGWKGEKRVDGKEQGVQEGSRHCS